MTGLLWGIAIGVVGKTLIPIPPLDDKVREGAAWLWSKTGAKLWAKIP